MTCTMGPLKFNEVEDPYFFSQVYFPPSVTQVLPGSLEYLLLLAH